MTRTDAVVIIMVVAVVVVISNLAVGVVLGFIVSATSAAFRICTATIVKEKDADAPTYKFRCQLFFASIN